MKKKFHLMFEAHHCVYFSSDFFSSFEDAKSILEALERYPFIDRLAVGFWEEIPVEGSGNLKAFRLCCESRRNLK